MCPYTVRLYANIAQPVVTDPLHRFTRSERAMKAIIWGSQTVYSMYGPHYRITISKQICTCHFPLPTLAPSPASPGTPLTLGFFAIDHTVLEHTSVIFPIFIASVNQVLRIKPVGYPCRVTDFVGSGLGWPP